MPIGVIPPPESRVTDEPKYCFEINAGWLPAIHAMVKPALYPEFWSGTLEQNRFARREVQNLMALLQDRIECEDMAGNNACCDVDVNVLVRINPDWSVDTSDDGGETYHDATSDPRYNMPHVPPPAAPIDKCSLAENYVEAFRVWVAKMHDLLGTTDNITDWLINAIEILLEAILIYLQFDPTKAGYIVTVVGLAFRHLYGKPQEEWDALWTEDVYDDIRCILFCRIGDDGLLSETGYGLALNDFLDGRIPGGTDVQGAAINAQNTFKFWGRDGVNQIMSAGHETSTDCDDCACDTCGEDWDIWQVGTILDMGVHPPGTFIQGGSVNVSGGFWMLVESAAPAVTPPAQAVTVKSPNKDSCCSVYFEDVSGTVANFFIINCGDEQDTANWNFSALQGSLSNAVELASGAPFTARLTFLGA